MGQPHQHHGGKPAASKSSTETTTTEKTTSEQPVTQSQTEPDQLPTDNGGAVSKADAPIDGD